jgi:hypothetical protein
MATTRGSFGFHQGLTTSEQNLLCCVASGTDLAKAGIPSGTAGVVAVKGLIVRDTTGQFALTDRGCAVLKRLQGDVSIESVQTQGPDRPSDREDDARTQGQIVDAPGLMARVDAALDRMKHLSPEAV